MFSRQEIPNLSIERPLRFSWNLQIASFPDLCLIPLALAKYFHLNPPLITAVTQHFAPSPLLDFPFNHFELVGQPYLHFRQHPILQLDQYLYLLPLLFNSTALHLEA